MQDGVADAQGASPDGPDHADRRAEATLMAFLDDLGIATQTVRHPPFRTVADAQALRGDLPGGHAKTLLVRDKKGAMALCVVEETRRVDLKALARDLGLGRLSFASPERLAATLGVRPGAVTPFALIHRRDPVAGDAPLKVVLDRALLAESLLNFHPLHNCATTTISDRDLVRYIVACGYSPVGYDFAAGGEVSPVSDGN